MVIDKLQDKVYQCIHQALLFGIRLGCRAVYYHFLSELSDATSLLEDNELNLFSVPIIIVVV